MQLVQPEVEATERVAANMSVEVSAVQRRTRVSSCWYPGLRQYTAGRHPSRVQAMTILVRNIGSDFKSSLEELLECHTSCKLLSSANTIFTWLPSFHYGLQSSALGCVCLSSHRHLWLAGGSWSLLHLAVLTRLGYRQPTPLFLHDLALTVPY